jgi:nonsense-mediated mRNA decay protein 3
MVRYCPVCGKSDSQATFHGELCVDCAKGRLGPLPPVKITLCQKCGSLIDRARKKKDASFGEEVVRLLHLKGKNGQFDAKKSEVEYDAGYGRVSQSVLVLEEKSICTECGRAGTQYFEAIIQLRGEGKKVSRMADMVMEKLEEKTFIPKIVELKEGLDVYVGSRNESIAALNAFGLPYVRTEKLAGQKEGRRLYRTTLLVRL